MMKTPMWLSPAVALLAASSLAPCRAEAAFGLVRNGPIRPAANLVSTRIKSFSRVLSGNGWETSIVLMNLGLTPVVFHQSFFASDGSLASFTANLPFNNSNITTSTLQGTIGPSGIVSFTLPDGNSSLQEGWSLLTFDGLPNQLSGYAITRHRGSSGNLSFEATLPLSDMLDSSARMPFDNTGGFQTQITIVNPATNLGAQVQLTYFNAQGQAILLDTLALKPGEQTTLTLPNTYPDLANQSGSISILGSINCLSVAGLRLNPVTGAISSVPVMDFSSGIALQ